ncbi:MAG: TRAP transporter large permease subunit, partial [bacterium]
MYLGIEDPFNVGIVGVVLLLVLIFSGVRVVYAASMVGLLGLVEIIGWDAGAAMVGTIPHSKVVSYPLSVLPMFILIGYLAYHAGITQQLFDAARKWLGWMPGGLAVSTVMATAGFAAVSGASTATAAVFSRVAIPDMLKYGYDRRLAAGVVAAGGTLATLIPPSAILVIYAIIVEESVGALLLAGFLPGIVSALIYVALIVIVVKIRPELGPAVHGYTWRDRFRSLPGVLPVVAVVSIVVSAIYLGWATPTEAGALGSFVVFALALWRRTKWRTLKDALMETAKLTVMIFSLIWGVLVFVRFLGFSGLPAAFTEFITTLDVPPIMILIGILLGYTILGMFMDAIGKVSSSMPIA